MKNKNFVFLAIAGLCISFASLQMEAKVKPATIFSDKMVLQQQREKLPLWGTASPNKQVRITTSWNNQSYTTAADKTGKWKTTITTPKAGGPYSITFNDGETTKLNDILIGEVWFCSGQSNMEMPMKGFPGQPLEQGTIIDIMRSTNPNIRLFNVNRSTVITPQEDVKGEWQTTTPSTVNNFSATAYYFGRLLQETLGTPVGLITAQWGASSIEAWMSREMLSDFPNIILPKTAADIKEAQRTPSTLYNGMIHPLKELGMKGMIWYQGESNIDRIPQYGALLEKFITSLRSDWKQGDFPFYYCQIAPYSYYKPNSAFLREQQMETESKVPNIGMAVLLDAGMKQGIHPQKKKVAGERLALQALSLTYGVTEANNQSPRYKSMTIQNDTIILNFDRAPMGLTSYYQPLKLFTVAGEDQQFYPAKAWIKKDQVFVLSDKVKQPVAARYAFENYVEGDLFGVEGLPVSSFRTDKFEK